MTTITPNPTPGLSRDELRRLAPSVFADRPWRGMSPRYRMVPTIDVVDILGERGFFPVRASQSRSRSPDKGAFTRHLLRFRREADIGRRDPWEEVPELVLTNSHDGSSAYRFMAGVFRLVCGNGLTVQSADFGSVSVRHAGGFPSAIRSPRPPDGSPGRPPRPSKRSVVGSRSSCRRASAWVSPRPPGG